MQREIVLEGLKFHVLQVVSDTGPILKLVTLRQNRVSANNKNYVSSKVIQLFSVSAGER